MNANRVFGWLAIGMLAVFALAGPARGADMNIALPTITANPGDTVFVLMNVNPSPDLFIDTRSLEYRLTLGSSVVQEARVMPEGFLYIWGAPFVNAGPDSVLAAAAGPTDMGTTSTLMSMVRIIVKPGAVVGTDLPLTFSRLLFNEGNPSLSFTPGVIKVRNGATGVGDDVAGAFALSPPTPNPARDRARIAFRLPANAGNQGATLELFALDGRCLRRETARASSNGVGEVGWLLADAQGRRLHAGLYFVRLSTTREQRTQRLIVMP